MKAACLDIHQVLNLDQRCVQGIQVCPVGMPGNTRRELAALLPLVANHQPYPQAAGKQPRKQAYEAMNELATG